MRLYYGTYGHHLSGKLYVYWGDDNLRTGQQVVAPVTNPKSGKNYNTMFTIARAQSVKNAQGEVSRLTENGIFIKTIPGRDVMSLPGAAPFKSKAEWKRDSDRRYRARFGIPEPQETPRRSPSSGGAGTSSRNASRPSAGRPAGKKRTSKSTAKKTLRTAAKVAKEAAERIRLKEVAKKNLLARKTAADSVRQQKGGQIKSREAFIED